MGVFKKAYYKTPPERRRRGRISPSFVPIWANALKNPIKQIFTIANAKFGADLVGTQISRKAYLVQKPINQF